MSILKILLENKVRITKFYEKQDFSTNILVRNLLNNYELIKSYFTENYPYKNITFKEYTDYQWIKLISPLDIVLNDLDEAMSLKLGSLLKFLKDIKFSDIEIRTYIKNNYKEIFDESFYPDEFISHDLMEETFKEIYKVYDFYPRDVFQYIESNFLNLILINFKVCEKYYEQNINYFNLLMNNNQHLFETNNFYYTFQNLSVSKKTYMVEFLSSKVEQTLKEVILLAENINVDNYISHIHPIEQISKIVYENKFKFVDLYKLEELKENLKSVEQEYMKKYGKSFSYGSIDFKEIYNDYVINFNKEDRMLYYVAITHNFSKDENKFISSFQTIFKRPKTATDYIAHSPGTDEYFSGSRLINLKIELDFKKHVLFYLLANEETKIHMYNFMCSILAEIDLKEFDGKSIMVDYFNSFYPTMMDIIIDENQESLENNFRSTSFVMFVISIIELLLRTVVINRNKETIFYSDNDFNLGGLLKTKQNNGMEYEDNLLSEIFGIEFIRTLEYLLTKTNDTNIGDNLRNNLMHNRNYEFKNMKNGIVIHTYYLFMNVINGLLVYYWNDNIKKY